MYSHLLLRLQVFSSNYVNYEGMWRDHILLINNLITVLHLFYMPDFHEQIIPQILILLTNGNLMVRDCCSKLIAKVIKFQHHICYREELINTIVEEYGRSESSAKRRTYIMVCKYAVEELPPDIMNKYFMELLI